jgi:hypothetical protein
MKNLLKGLMWLGIFLIIGSTGSSDLRSISFKDTILQISISFALIGVGYYSQLFMANKKKLYHKIEQHQKTGFAKAA